VDTAGSGKEAIALCMNTDYHIVFMDEMMPEMNGIEAMKQIRSIRSWYAEGGNSKIIALTADAISGTRVRLMQEGFDEYLGKPINLNQLERLLVRFLPADKIKIVEKIQKKQEISSEEAKEKQYLKETLTKVDTQKGIENCGGKVADYLKVLRITYEHGEKQLEELRRMQHGADYQNYTIKIHSMKSTSLNLGAVEISKMAKRQEIAGEAGNFAHIDAHMEEFQEEYGQLLEEIGQVLEHYGLIGKEEDDQEKLSDDMVCSILANIRNCLEEFEFPKIFEILQEVKKYKLSERYEQVFRQIEEWMDDLAVDEIQELIEKTLP